MQKLFTTALAIALAGSLVCGKSVFPRAQSLEPGAYSLKPALSGSSPSI